MEGKKIAFIVVAIATVGGVAYYLNKRNKQLVGALATAPETRSEKIAKVKDYYEKGATAIAPTYTASSENDEYRGDSKPSQRVATGYKS